MIDYAGNGAPTIPVPGSVGISTYLDKANGVIYFAVNGAWVPFNFSAVDGLTAKAGGGQAGATAISAQITRFSVVATLNDSGLLPKALPGMSITVTNAGAAGLNVFPATGESINALAANAAFAVAAGKSCDFYCAKAGVWHTILSA